MIVVCVCCDIGFCVYILSVCLFFVIIIISMLYFVPICVCAYYVPQTNTTVCVRRCLNCVCRA